MGPFDFKIYGFKYIHIHIYMTTHVQITSAVIV